MPAILIAVFTAIQTPAIAKDAADLKELHRLEAVWNEAHVRGDAAALDGPNMCVRWIPGSSIVCQSGPCL